MTLVLSPKKLTLLLSVVVVGLIAAHVGTAYLRFFQGHDYQFGFERQLNLSKENNIPTWYSSSALLLSAMLLTVTGLVNKKKGNPYTYHWLGLAAIFLFLSIDEAASLHEMTGMLLQGQLSNIEYLYGLLFFGWIVFGLMFVLIIGGIYLPFVAALPSQTRRLFVIAGILYVGGALGVEALEARNFYLYQLKDFTFSMLVACEEGLEMLGNIVFIYALLSNLESSVNCVKVHFGCVTTDRR